MPNTQASHDEPPPGLPLMVAAEVQDDLLVASNDLERLQRLLSDAGDSLLAHFHGAATELATLQQAGSVAADGAEPPLQRSMAHVAGAITAMQFQDMATQLIAHTALRLRGCADRLARHALGDDEDGEAVVEAPPMRPNPVTQDEMDAGSIELF